MVRWYNLFSWACLFCAAGFAVALPPVPLPPEETARGLLLAPVQATWAANHVDHWRALGVDALAFMGIFESFADNPWARDGRPLSIGEDDQLLKEVALANRRLCEDGGLTGNFLYYPFAPQAPWLTDPVSRRALLRGLRDAAEFARVAGLRGIVADTASSAAVWDSRWDGYPLEDRDFDRLDAAARGLGRDAMGEMAGAFPDLELLLIADDMPQSGPFWLSFVAGLIEGMGAADTISVHVLLRESLFETRPLSMAGLVERTTRLIAERLPDEETRDRWGRYGSVGLGLRPLGRNGAGEPVRYYEAGDFRRQLWAAKSLCAHWFWVEDSAQCWWRVGEEEAAQYDALYQLRGTASSQIRPVAPNLDAYTWHTPLDGLRRVGPYETEAGPATVFQAGGSAAALFWSPPAKLARVPSGRTVRVTRVRDGAVSDSQPAEGGRLVLPEGEPCLVAPLPEVDWVLPAALWLEAMPLLTPGQGGSRLHFGFRNPLPYTAAGVMQVTPPPALGIGAASPAFSLKPGESAQLTRTVQGVLDSHPGYAFGMTLLLPEEGGRPERFVQRTFHVPVVPPMRALALLEGVPLGPPWWLGDGAGEGRLLVTTQAGISALDAMGRRQWHWAAPRPLITPAAVMRGRLGERAIAVCDVGGGLVRLDPEGNLIERVLLSDPAASGPLFTAQLFDGPSDVLVYARAAGGVCAVAPQGTSLWTYAEGGPVRQIALWAIPGEAVLFAVTDRELHALTRDGDCLWSGQTAGRATTPPQVAPGTEGDLTVSIGTVQGIVQQFDALTGVERQRFPLPSRESVYGLQVIAGPNPDAPAFFAADAARIHALNAAGAPVWSYAAPGVTAIALAYFGGTPVLLASADDGLHALSIGGSPRWHDPRPASRVLGPPLVVDLDGHGEVCAAFTAADRTLRILELGPRNRPRMEELAPENVLLRDLERPGGLANTPVLPNTAAEAPAP